MTKLIPNALFLVLFVVYGSDLALASWFEKPRDVVTSADVSVELLEVGDFEKVEISSSYVSINYEAQKPDEKDVKKERICQKGTSVIPSFGVCSDRAVRIDRKFALGQSAVGRALTATIGFRLSGPGDYLAENGHLAIQVRGEESPRFFNFRIGSDPKHKQALLTKDIDSVESLKIGRSVILKSLSDKIGFPSDKTFLYDPNYTDVMNSFAYVMRSPPLAFLDSSGEILVNPAPIYWDIEYCFGRNVPDQLSKVILQNWGTYREIEFNLELAQAKCLRVENDPEKEKNREMRRLSISVKDRQFVISSYRSVGNRSFNELLVLDSKFEVKTFFEKEEVDKKGWRVARFEYWVPGLEKIYPSFAKRPSDEKVKKLKNKYMKMLEFFDGNAKVK